MPKGVFIRTNEHRKNLSLSHLGNPSPMKGKKLGFVPIKSFKKDHIPWNKGLKGIHLSPKTEFKKGTRISIEIRKKLSASHKGEKSYLWKGGITPDNEKVRHSIENRLWKESVFSRDNWTCQKCGKRGGDLHSHHIKQFSTNPELRFAIDNGKTLCKKCHKKEHSK